MPNLVWAGLKMGKDSQQSSSRVELAATPYMAWLLFFLLGPLVFILLLGFQQKGLWGGVEFVWTGDNYRRVFDGLYLRVLFASVYLAGMTSLSCLVIGYPMAWFISRQSPTLRKVLLILVMLPFMSNFVVRAYAVKFLMGVEGPINHLLLYMGVMDSPLLMANPTWAIWFGMVTNYLPFMVLPLYVAFERFDIVVLEAARDLGASSWKTWWSVLWPLTRIAALTGATLVFIPALGEFVIPDLMGGGRTMFLGNLLADQFLKARDWPFGAAICVSAVIMVALIILLMKSAVRIALRVHGGAK
jgi:spermidine/putrescine transport system permease protein